MNKRLSSILKDERTKLNDRYLSKKLCRIIKKFVNSNKQQNSYLDFIAELLILKPKITCHINRSFINRLILTACDIYADKYLTIIEKKHLIEELTNGK